MGEEFSFNGVTGKLDIVFIPTESDPIWAFDKPNYLTILGASETYQPIGNYLETETDPLSLHLDSADYGASVPAFSGNDGKVLGLSSGSLAWVTAGGNQTPWTSDIDADGYKLTDLSRIDLFTLAEVAAFAPITTGSGSYTTSQTQVSYKVWPYKTIDGVKFYSKTYTETISSIVSDNSSFTVDWTATPVAGADGYLVSRTPLYNIPAGFNYWADIGANTSFTDDGTNSSPFDSATTYTPTVGGSINNIGTLNDGTTNYTLANLYAHPLWSVDENAANFSLTDFNTLGTGGFISTGDLGAGAVTFSYQGQQSGKSVYYITNGGGYYYLFWDPVAANWCMDVSQTLTSPIYSDVVGSIFGTYTNGSVTITLIQHATQVTGTSVTTPTVNATTVKASNYSIFDDNALEVRGMAKFQIDNHGDLLAGYDSTPGYAGQKFWSFDVNGDLNLIYGNINDDYGKILLDPQQRLLVGSDGTTTKFNWETMQFPTFTTNGVLTTSNSDGSLGVLANSAGALTNDGNGGLSWGAYAPVPSTTGIAVWQGSAWADCISGSSYSFVKGDGSLDPTTYLSSDPSPYIPAADDTSSLGDSTHRFKSLYLMPTSLYLGTTHITENAYNRNELNMMLAHFKLSVIGGLAKYNLVDGIMDEYEDETGVDTANSTNESYDATNDLYSPTSSGSGVATPYAHYKMNDNAASTDVVDNINSLTMTASANTSTLTTTGKISSALVLDGTGTYNSGQRIESTSTIFADGATNWSIFAWVLSEEDDRRQQIVSMGTEISTGKGLFLFKNVGNNLAFDLSRYAGATGGSMAAGTSWYHVGVVSTNGIVQLWLNGVASGDPTDLSGVMDYVNLQNVIGASLEGSAWGWHGKVDDVRFYRSALSQSQIEAIYNSGSGTEDDSGETPTIDNMTLISNATTAEAAPSTARIVIFEEDVDTLTPNTDIKAYVSRDGTNYTQITLSDEGDYGTGKRILTGLGAISSASGTSMKYKIETLNNKNCKIHGTGLQWD